jgi:hypothetical protein
VVCPGQHTQRPAASWSAILMGSVATSEFSDKCIAKEARGSAEAVVLELGTGFACDDVRDVFERQRLGLPSRAEAADVTSANSVRESEGSEVTSDVGILE